MQAIVWTSDFAIGIDAIVELTKTSAGGATQATIVPLYARPHLSPHLSHWLAELRRRHPTTTISLTPAVGETDEVVQALASATLKLL